MRTLTWFSRAFVVAAAIAAAILIVGGSYFVGFVGEVQRGLSDPDSANRQAAEKIALVEQTLGYHGYLKFYRSFRLTGDVAAREQMTMKAVEASRTLDQLRALYADTPNADRTIQDLNSIIGEFAHVARIAPDMGPAALRGSASMDALESMPQLPQLEATYLTLRTALERLRSQTQSHQMGSIAWALTWSQSLIVGALAALVCGLIGSAALLRLKVMQPIASLEQSLKAIGNGRVTDPVWGVDRSDEIGEMARATEKLRKSLTETEALKEIAQKGEIHLRLDGDAAIVFDKLTQDIASATDALKSAASQLTESQNAQREQFGNSIQKLANVAPKLDEMVNAISKSAAAKITEATDDLRDEFSKIVASTSERATQFEQTANRFESGGKHLSEAVDLIRGKTSTAIDGLTSSITAFKKAADGAQSIQGAFFNACDRISSDASATADNIKSLANQLNSVVDAVDTKLQRKIHALDRLEVGIETTLGSIERRAKETTEAIATAAAAIEKRSQQNEQRVEQSVEDFEAIVSLFRDDHAKSSAPTAEQNLALLATLERLNQACTNIQEQLAKTASDAPYAQALTTALARKIDLSISALQSKSDKSAETLATALETVEQRSLQSEKQVDRSLAEFQELLNVFRNGPTSVTSNPQSSSPVELAPLSQQIETLRAEIRELAMRMTEERILMTAEMPASALHSGVALSSQRTGKSLNDVPMPEILRRLNHLAEEMNAAGQSVQTSHSLDTALSEFSVALKTVAASSDPLSTLNAKREDLHRLAEAIDGCAAHVSPSAGALNAELHAITGELRALAEQVAHANGAKALDELREQTRHLGARAESLHTYLHEAHGKTAEAVEDPSFPAPETIEEMSQDLETLAKIIGKLETRTVQLSDEAVAANLRAQTGGVEPGASVRPGQLRAQDGTAITAVFDSIDRLNNIAAALARADDADTLRQAAG